MRLQSLRRWSIRTGLDVLHAGQAHRLFGRATAGVGAILMFHHVRKPRQTPFRPNSHLEIAPDFLLAVVRRVRELGFDIVDLDEAERRLRTGEGPRFVVLTFDDGYRNNFSDAYPILKGESAPFTVYVATGLVDGLAWPWWDVAGAIVASAPEIRFKVGDRLYAGPTVEPEQKYRMLDTLIAALIGVSEEEQRRDVAAVAAAYGIALPALPDEPMMNWDEVRALAADPLATIGAHTVGHYALARLDAERARREMAESIARIEAETGRRPRHFAYPYGSPDTAGAREFAMAADLGFATAVTTQRGLLHAADARRPMALPRISVNGDYQALRYLDLLLWGVPYAIEKRLNRIRGRAPASASS